MFSNKITIIFDKIWAIESDEKRITDHLTVTLKELGLKNISVSLNDYNDYFGGIEKCSK